MPGVNIEIASYIHLERKEGGKSKIQYHKSTLRSVRKHRAINHYSTTIVPSAVILLFVPLYGSSVALTINVFLITSGSMFQFTLTSKTMAVCGAYFLTVFTGA